jgi:hypothetical protein
MRMKMVAVFALASLCAFGQYKAPRTWDGKPDIQGIWQVQSNAHFDLEPHNASTGIPAGPGIIVDPPDGKIPYLPGALAKKQQNFAGRETLDPVNKCYMPGVPRLTYMPYPLQIFQTPVDTIIASEYVHNYRTIHTAVTKHLDGVDFWNGDSRGHWEGDTLVVDVAGFNDQTWFDRAGNYHSDQLHVVERYTRTSPNTLMYEATIEDPKTFSRPWKIAVPLYLHEEKNFRLLEYECHAYLEDAAKATR